MISESSIRLQAMARRACEEFAVKLGSPDTEQEALMRPWALDAFKLGYTQFVTDITHAKQKVRWFRVMSLEAEARFSESLGPPKDDAHAKARKTITSAFRAGWLTAASDLRGR